MQKRHAKIIAFEGPDKTGKETQSKMAVEALRRAGARAERIEAPTKATRWTHRLIYWMLRTDWAKRLPNFFQLVQTLNKLSFQLFHLPGIEARNDVVVFDRWGLSSVIYGTATGVNPKLVLWFYERIKPADLTIIFAERSYRRPTMKDDSYETDSLLQARVRDMYRDWALTHSVDHVLVDNARPVEDVHREVMDRIVTPCRTCGARIGEDCDAGLHS